MAVLPLAAYPLLPRALTSRPVSCANVWRLSRHEAEQEVRPISRGPWCPACRAPGDTTGSGGFRRPGSPPHKTRETPVPRVSLVDDRVVLPCAAAAASSGSCAAMRLAVAACEAGRTREMWRAHESARFFQKERKKKGSSSTADTRSPEAAGATAFGSQTLLVRAFFRTRRIAMRPCTGVFCRPTTPNRNKHTHTHTSLVRLTQLFFCLKIFSKSERRDTQRDTLSLPGPR